MHTVIPLEEPTLIGSIRSTGRAVVIHEAPGFTEVCFCHLEAPIRRVADIDTLYPAPLLEQHYLPNADRVLDAAHSLLEYA
ncbi:MAG: hypothetical protein JO362_23425 [Streptomycetaceae bacterium]|nr:hypothetical protein [Streptomycetaceae bacterium]